MQLQYDRPEDRERPHTDWVGKIVSRIGKTPGIIVDEGNPRTGRGVKCAITHDLRRAFAVRLRPSSVPPYLIQKLMRDTDYRTTT